MKTDTLGPRWIFAYFQFLGLHSSEKRSKFNLLYQAILVVLLTGNFVFAIYFEILGNGVDATTAFVDTIDSKF